MSLPKKGLTLIIKKKTSRNNKFFFCFALFSQKGWKDERETERQTKNHFKNFFLTATSCFVGHIFKSFLANGILQTLSLIFI